MTKRKTMPRKRVTGRQLLDRAGENIYLIFDLANSDPGDAAKMLRAAEKCTETNCGWATYEAAKLLLAKRHYVKVKRGPQ